ncbi:MAG: ABC transporter substrate-binding protein [Bacillota bacterium]
MRRFLTVLLVMTLVLGAAGSVLAQNEDPEYGGTLIYAQGADADALDPHMTTLGNSADVIVNVFDGLVRFKSGTTEIEPALATDWEVSDDGLEYVFHLREGVEFHDGTPFNAEAVVFDIERQLDPEHPYYLEGAYPYAGFSLGMIEKVEEVDEYTVKFTLEDPYAPFLKNLAMFATMIASPEAVKEYGEDIFKHPVGTGPFEFVEWVRDDHITLKANEDYWDGRPYLDELIFTVIPNNQTRLLELEEGNIHVMEGLNPTDVERVVESDNLDLLEAPGLNIGYIALHNEKEPFDNKMVRKAMNYAINKEEIAKYLMGGQATPAKGPLSPTIWSYDDTLEGYPYNPEKAKSLLKGAGYGDGFEFTLRTYSAPRAYNPVGSRLATAVQQYLSEVGIKANIEQLEWGTYIEEGKAGKHTAAFFGWIADNGDPDNFLNVFFNSANQGSTNRAFYTNPKVDDLLEQAQQITDEDKRERIYKQVQGIIVDDAPFVFLNHMKMQIPVRSNVENYVLYPTNNKYFHKVWLDQ